MDLDGLELQVDGVRRTMAQWTKDFVDSYYPHIGVDCYRVPAQHFNQQKLDRPVEGASEKLQLLRPPMPCIAAGDLAHTQVLDALESLSHDLKDQKEGPLFIISSVNYDNYLAKLPKDQPKNKRKKKKKGADGGSAQAVPESKRMRTAAGGEEFPPESGDVGGGGETRKPAMPPRPADRNAQRGEIDVLILHEGRGVTLIEVKSTGFPDPEWKPTEEKQRKSIKKAAEQLDGARDVLHYIMPDLTLTPLSLVIALPFLRKEQVEQIVSSLSLDPHIQFLCQEDLQSPPAQEASRMSQPSAAAGDPEGVHGSNMLRWWRSTMSSADPEGMPVKTIRTMVGRICGLMSVVSVWTNSKPRVEVRTQSQALGEAGRRVSDIVLLPRQADLLADPTLHRVWITGPAGSGKTLMLQLKGRQWVREGRRVVVFNVRTVARGRPIGYVLEEGIRQGGEGLPGTGRVDRCDVALDECSLDMLHKELAERGPMEDVCFVVDEVLSDMSGFAEQLARRYPDSPLWCVASLFTHTPDGFQACSLRAVLRNPPSVQLMLREMDPRHREVYTTRSAARGLSCDGPPIIFIQHSTHDTSVRHLDCLQCANDLADIFESKLGLQLRPPAAPGSEHPDSNRTTLGGSSSHNSTSGSKSEQSSKTIEATPLSFRDVLILLALPSSAYVHVTGYHYKPIVGKILEYMKYMGTCRFLKGLRQRGVPYKVAVDNTLKEIAFPPEDEVIITDVMGAHSLERKVVVFLRGGGPLTEAEVAEHISRYQIVQAASLPVPHPDPSRHDASSQQQGLKPGPEAEALSKEMLFFASLANEVRDWVYPQLPTTLCPSSAADLGTAVINFLLGNMVVEGTRSFVQGEERQEERHREGPEASKTIPAEVRVGAEVTGSDAVESDTLQADPGESGERQESMVHVIEADSVFLVPDLEEDLMGWEEEVRRVKAALAVLSENDKEWEFLAASRCLSQYISILP